MLTKIVCMVKKKTDRHKYPGMTVRLPKEQADALRAIADTEERTPSVVIARALRDYAKAHGYRYPGIPPVDPPTD